MNVCNMSLGSTRRDLFELLHELTDEAYFRNIVLVTAANNVPIASAPSLYAAVVSVAAHEIQDPTLVYCNPNPRSSSARRGSTCVSRGGTAAG